MTMQKAFASILHQRKHNFNLDFAAVEHFMCPHTSTHLAQLTIKMQQNPSDKL